MTKYQFLTLSSLTCFAAASAFGEEMEIKLKFEPGMTYVSESNISQSSVLPMGDQQVKSKTKIVVVAGQVVTKDGDNVKVVQKPMTMTMNMDAGGMEMTFDSENPEGPMAATLTPMMDATTTMTVAPDGKIVSVKAEGVAGMEALGMGEDEMKQAAREVVDLIPNKTVSVGDTWKTETTLPMPGLLDEPVGLTYTMTFDSVVEQDGHKMAKILIKGEVEAAGEDVDLVLTANELDGSILFDPKVGQPREYKMKMDLEVGLPEGVEAAEGGAGKMPMKIETLTTLKEIKKSE